MLILLIIASILAYLATIVVIITVSNEHDMKVRILPINIDPNCLGCCNILNLLILFFFSSNVPIIDIQLYHQGRYDHQTKMKAIIYITLTNDHDIHEQSMESKMSLFGSELNPEMIKSFLIEFGIKNITA